MRRKPAAPPAGAAGQNRASPPPRPAEGEQPQSQGGQDADARQVVGMAQGAQVGAGAPYGGRRHENQATAGGEHKREEHVDAGVASLHSRQTDVETTAFPVLAVPAPAPSPRDWLSRLCPPLARKVGGSGRGGAGAVRRPLRGKSDEHGGHKWPKEAR